MTNQNPGVPRDLATSHDFIMVRAALVAHLGGANEALVWTRIQWRTDTTSPVTYERDDYRWWRASRAEMAAETGLTSEQVRRALERLIAGGFLEGVQHGRMGNYDRAMSYRCRIDGAHTPDEQGVDAPSHGAHTPDVPYQDTETKAKDEEHPDGALLVIEPYEPTTDDLFSDLWTVYPRHDGKAAARKAYDKALTKIPAEDLRLKCEAWSWAASRAMEKRFMPHLSTWLNGERWDDDLPEPPKVPARGSDAVARGAAADQALLDFMYPPTTEQREIER